jgi:acetoin utilization deacetylase AcuC-like enzyme
MQILYSPDHERHQPKTFLRRGVPMPNPEVAERARRLLAAVQADGHRIDAPSDFGPDPRAAVHTPDYLEFLATIWQRWRAMPDAGPEIVPNVHPGRTMSRRPIGATGLAGYYTADTACPISEGTWVAACAAANAAVHAAALVLDGAPVAYALCRPPGHHAYADMAGGFCYLNNVAIAAQHMRGKLSKIAILDIDVHAGNGTAGIFEQRDDVFFCSLHADPADYYPFYAGYADERGTGPGEGCTLNLPLPQGSGDEAVLAAVDRGIAAIKAYQPDALLVSLGFDASERDPLGVFKVTTDGFGAIAQRVARLGLPTVLIQEGGYLSDILGANLARFLRDFEASLSRRA